MSIPTTGRGAASGAAGQARRAADSTWLERGARLGFLAKGLVYALIGLLALQIATGGGGKADQKGALQTIASKSGGSLVLWLMVIGFAAYALWRISEAAWGRRDETDEKKRTLKRIGSLLNGLVYAFFAVLAFRTVSGTSSSSGNSSDITAKALKMSGGELIVGIAGVLVIGIAIALALRGYKTDFEKHLSTGQMSPTMFKAVRRLGQVGYIARGGVLLMIGILVITAATDNQPGKAAGFDVALKTMADGPLGQFLLVLAALGLICFGIYCVAEARYRRL